MFKGKDDQTVGEDADNDGWDAIEQVGGVTDDESGFSSAELREINGAEKSDRDTQEAARIKSLALPTMALAMPPPVSPTGAGSLVKKSQLMEVPPW